MVGVVPTGQRAILAILAHDGPRAGFRWVGQRLCSTNARSTSSPRIWSACDPPLATIYTELTSTGGLSGVSDPELRGALTRYGDACALFAQVQPHAKSALLDPRARYYRAVEWSVDPSAWDRDDAIVSYDWTELREARSELQAWQAYQEEVASIAKLQLKEVRAVLAILEEGRK